MIKQIDFGAYFELSIMQHMILNQRHYSQTHTT